MPSSSLCSTYVADTLYIFMLHVLQISFPGIHSVHSLITLRFLDVLDSHFKLEPHGNPGMQIVMGLGQQT